MLVIALELARIGDKVNCWLHLLSSVGAQRGSFDWLVLIQRRELLQLGNSAQGALELTVSCQLLLLSSCFGDGLSELVLGQGILSRGFCLLRCLSHLNLSLRFMIKVGSWQSSHGRVELELLVLGVPRRLRFITSKAFHTFLGLKGADLNFVE